MDQAQGNACLRCHAPLAEQKALLAIDRDWPGRPASPPPAWVPADLHLRGLACAACHVRGHRRFGPPRAADAPPPPERAPHGGFEAEPAFGDSRFCGTCHQFKPDGRQVNGKLLENTLAEWRDSRHAREGRACQACHMPGRRHLWRGVHDPEMVRAALLREMSVTRTDAGHLRIRVVLGNRGAGHYLPTYVVPKIHVDVVLRGPGTHMLVGRHVIGRTLDVALAHESADTRLAPDARRTLEYEVAVPPGAWRAVLRTEVAPGEHYERMFADMRRRHPEFDGGTRALLDQALGNAVGARYFLEELSVAAPEAVGARAQAVAN